MKYKPVDLRKLQTVPLGKRVSKVRIEDFARPAHSGASFSEFMSSIPDILSGHDFRAIINAIVQAYRSGCPVILGMGAHVIKCGLSPVIIDLMERGVITCVAMNGAGPIHDTEIALVGHTSEDVQAGLKDGEFGMARETGELIFESLRDAGKGMGFGEAVGRKLLALKPPFCHLSILAAAARLDIPATVHIAIGTDIIHMHPGASGADVGRTSHTDFRLLASVIASLSGGVYINAGSAVILPEVFLKAFTVAQNLGARLHDFTTVNLDMITHYRPTINVIQRPASVGGQGYMLNGRHELLIPLLAFAIVEALYIADGTGGSHG